MAQKMLKFRLMPWFSNNKSNCSTNRYGITLFDLEYLLCLRPLHTAERHRPTMFHTATVKPTRSGPNILYNTSLIVPLGLFNIFLTEGVRWNFPWVSMSAYLICCVSATYFIWSIWNGTYAPLPYFWMGSSLYFLLYCIGPFCHLRILKWNRP